jgi:WD40 repeat protein
MSVAFSPNGKTLLSGSYKNKITLWDIDTGSIIKTFDGHSGSVNSVQFSPNGKFALSASADKTLKLWNIETGELVRTYSGHSNEVAACRFFQDGEKFISADHNLICEIKLWDVNYPNELRTIKGLRSYVRDLDITPDGKQIIYGNYDGYVNVWDLNTLKIEKSFVDNKNLFGASTYLMMENNW